MTALPAPAPRTENTADTPRHGRVGSLLAAMFLVNVFGYAANVAAITVLLPSQVREAAGDGAVAALALVNGVSAIASFGIPPLVGLMSDRTRTRWGRRSPWILGGGVATAAALVLTGAVSGVTGLMIGWFLVQATINVGLNIILATIPEGIPARRHGLASTVQGVGVPVGGVIGVQLGAALVDSVMVAYALLGGLFLIASVISAVLIRDRSGAALDDPGQARPPMGRQFMAMFSSLRDRDYRWVFISRAVIYLGYNTVFGFSLYILQDHIVLPDGLAPASAVATSQTISIAFLTVATLISGPLVDRVGRHRGFVLTSSLLLAASIVLPLFSPSWTMFLVQAGLSGFALGAFLGVDLSLATIVLPKTGDAGRDLGVFHIALNAPQVVAPFFAALAVERLGGYPALFIVGGVFAFLGSLTVLRVRPQRVSE
ncbi:MFS transporter [Spongiactinospora rosea]|uniref:MFS transporter n=1 Tax=Spongiactinospora rosea TaxID=2248750 RepID=A0A366LNU9_9ACTN|nr:MFS transporter [Spongiactinospora rosea]RBQ14964.1 MFS transporter [Spongiactinospora rosea]